MTRFSNDNDFIDPRTLVGQTDNTNPAFANNMGNTSVQPQFAEYVMPTAPGRVPSSASNFYASGAEAVSYGAQGNMSVQTADGGYAWAGNNPAHNMSFRERQMYHAQQEERQEALYYRATTPNYSNYNYPPDYSNYNYGPTYGPDYGADWNGQTTPLYTPAVAYQGDTGYIPPAPYPPAPYYPGQDGGNLASAAPAPDNTYQYGADGSPVAATPPGPDYSRTNANPGDAQVASAAPQGNSGGWTPYDFEVYNNLKEKAQELTGHCIQEYDKSVPVRLGCARAVSLLVTGGYGFDVKDQSVRGLEHTLRHDGFTEVSIADMKPGDVICAYRKPGDYGHAAVYMGNGQIFNNDSDMGKMEIQSIAKYNKAEFKHFVILRRPARVPAINGDAATATTVADASTSAETEDS